MRVMGTDPFELEDINLDYEEQSTEPMTTVVGIKSNAGIVLGSDSQWTSSIKNFSGKLFEINKWVGLGVSGTRSYIRLLVKRLEDGLSVDDLKSEQIFRDRIDGLLAQLFRERVTNRSTDLGYPVVANLFEAIAILGARLSNGEYALYQLSLMPPDPVVEVFDDYCAIGTGMNYAYLLLRQQTRAVLTSGMKMADSDLESNVWLGAFAINEIKTFDKHTSGNTRVAIIDENGFREYNRKEIIDKYEAKRDEIANIISRLGIEKEVARSLYPDP